MCTRANYSSSELERYLSGNRETNLYGISAAWLFNQICINRTTRIFQRKSQRRLTMVITKRGEDFFFLFFFCGSLFSFASHLECTELRGVFVVCVDVLLKIPVFWINHSDDWRLTYFINRSLLLSLPICHTDFAVILLLLLFDVVRKWEKYTLCKIHSSACYDLM